MQIFQANLMASEDLKSFLGQGYYYVSTTKTAIHDGAVVSVGDIEAHSVYASLKDVNVRKLTAPSATTSKVAIVDYVDVSSGDINGVNYRMGYKTAGLVAPAGKLVRYRKLMVGDSFYLGKENFDTAPADGKFANPTASDTIWTVANSALSNATVIKIETSKALTEGTVNTSTLYFCTVVSVA